MLYDYKTNTMGHITITRLSDGATRYLQAQDDVEAFQEVERGCDALPIKMHRRADAIMQAYCAEYFAE